MLQGQRTVLESARVKGQHRQTGRDTYREMERNWVTQTEEEPERPKAKEKQREEMRGPEGENESPTSE